jgi:hypothetical protein
MPDAGLRIPHEALVNLRHRLETLPVRHSDRKGLVADTAALYGVSRATLYRGLRQQLRPSPLHRSDRGKPKVIPAAELERYCETIAAMKLRTLNGKGRHLSTARAIQILEEHGVETPGGPVRLPPGLLGKATANRYLRQWGYDHERMTRPPAALRFQAEQSNALWHFDLSPSDLKQIDCPAWVEPGRGTPTLMIYSVVDDRSGVAYQEYHCVYGEDVEAALRFLFNAMAPKPEENDSPFQGIPAAIYCDSGPIAKSGVFRRVMEHLGVAVLRHLPAGKDGRRPTARSKGKVERPFRTVKEAHETLYHFHKPETETEANRWLKRYLSQYNAQLHRSEPHSRLEDWLANLPVTGIREMCAWAVLCLRAGAGAAPGQQRRPCQRRGRPLRSGRRPRRRDSAALVGPVRPGPLHRAWRRTTRSLPSDRRPDPAAPLPSAPKRPTRTTRRSRRRFGPRLTGAEGCAGRLPSTRASVRPRTNATGLRRSRSVP